MSTKLSESALAEIREHNRDGFGVNAIEVDKLFNHCTALEEELKAAQDAIRRTLDENGHLADGENCTLIHLKRALRLER